MVSASKVSNRQTREQVERGPAAALPQASSVSYLMMYSERPSEELTLSDFEVLALSRLAGWWRSHDIAHIVLVVRSSWMPLSQRRGGHASRVLQC